MTKKAIVLTVIILLSAACFVKAQEGKLSGTLDFSYLTSYIWRGFDVYGPGSHGAYQTGLDLDLFGTGVGMNFRWSRCTDDDYENSEGLDFGLYYNNTIYEDETYATDYRIGWVYYSYPDEPRDGSPNNTRGMAADMQEFSTKLSWPNVCPVGIVPSYTIVSLWPSVGNSRARNNAGWLHIFGLAYDWPVAGLIGETPQQNIHLTAEMVYNDGAAPGVVPGTGTTTASKIDHDWSHAVFGISTDFDLGNNFAFTPGFYYQSSWDDSVNSQDETWFALSVKYKF